MQSPQTIVLFLFGDLGDTIVTVPAIRAVRNRYPATRLVLVGKRVARDYLLGLKLLDDAILVDKHAFDSPIVRPSAWPGLFGIISQLRQAQPDVVVIFHHLASPWGALKYGLLARASRAPIRVGIDNGRGRWFLTKSVADRGFGACHEVDYRLQVAALLDAFGDTRLDAPITDEDRVRAKQLLPQDGYFVIHPGTGWYGPGRQWGGENFAEVARRLLNETELRCVVVGTLEDRAHAEAVIHTVTGAVDLVAKTSLGELAAVLEGASFLVDNDSGVGHLAAAVGTRVVAVFGPSNDRAWRPLTSTVIQVDLPCRPCFYRDFETGSRWGCAGRECLQLVQPAQVVAAALELLEEPPLDG